MEPFFLYHPGSSLADKLFAEKDWYISQIVKNPIATIELLAEKYKFGAKSDFWDDYIFLLVISPALAQICEAPDLRFAVNAYSALDHSLFLKYIRRDEDPVRFRRAFWNVNSYGKQLSARFGREFCKSNNTSSLLTESQKRAPTSCDDLHKIAFVFKGGFRLAHAEFLHEFLRGSAVFADKVKVTLILLDADTSDLANSGIDHVEVVSLRSGDTFSKMKSYYSLAFARRFDHISWVACVQNLSLFMGQKLSQSQSYWSMKYHSVIMNTLDKYAGLGFGGESFEFDDVKWFRGRAFPSLKLPFVKKEKLNHVRQRLKIPADAIVGGCFVRAEKLNNKDFWCLVEKLLTDLPQFHFVIASQSLPAAAANFLDLPIFRNKFHHLGWVNTKEWCQYLDIYLDSFPRGSCLTALESIKAKVPLILFDSIHNRESSALPYLMSAAGGHTPPGVYEHSQISSTYDQIKLITSSETERSNLASLQFNLLKSLEGSSPLYAKDYLNYFLDTSLSVKGVSLR